MGEPIGVHHVNTQQHLLENREYQIVFDRFITDHVVKIVLVCNVLHQEHFATNHFTFGAILERTILFVVYVAVKGYDTIHTMEMGTVLGQWCQSLEHAILVLYQVVVYLGNFVETRQAFVVWMLKDPYESLFSVQGRRVGVFSFRIVVLVVHLGAGFGDDQPFTPRTILMGLKILFELLVL
jgi:hypothetical protein